MAAGTAMEHDQVLCHRLRNVLAQIISDESDRQIDSRCDTRRSPESSVTDEDAVGIQLQVGVLVPDACFTEFPLGLTMEGQYIVKNLILISAAIVVAGTLNRQSSWNKVL